MIPTIEGDHVKEQLFGPVIFGCAEYHIQFNSPRASCFSTGDNSSKGSVALLNACSVDLHFVERVFLDEVKPTVAVHEHLGKIKAVHNGV